MAGKKGLGRGLDALLGLAPNGHDGYDSGELRELPIESIDRSPYQPRLDMREETLAELAESIRVQGVVQPIVVRVRDNGRFEIVAGERRWRAAQMVGMQQVPVVVRHLTDQAVMAVALIENIQREDLNPLEEAGALSRLVTEHALTHGQAAEAVGRSRAAVSNLLRLLELAPEVQDLLRQRHLDMGHARALLPLEHTLQRQAANQVVARALSVRETEQLVRRLQARPHQGAGSEQVTDPDIRRLQDELGERLGAKVQLQHTSAGKGKLIIHYNTVDELDGILRHVS